MKSAMGPMWSAEQIAAGKRFGQEWLDFFARGGSALPPLPFQLRTGIETATLTAVRAKHEPRLLRYPNVVGVTEGTRMRAGKPTGEPAIVVLVSAKVPRKGLPKPSQLPPELDGMPIDVVEVGPIEALSVAPRARTKTRATTRKRAKVARKT